VSVAAQLKYLNLLPAQYNIMLALSQSRNAGLTLQHLCNDLSLRPTTCRHHTGILAVRGFLDRRAHQDVHITPVGKAILRAAQEILAQSRQPMIGH